MADTKEFKESNYSVENTIVPEEIERTETGTPYGIEPTNQYWNDGKRIYREVFDFGAMPNGTNTSKNLTSTTAMVDEVVDIRAIYEQDPGGTIYASNLIDGASEVGWRIDRGTPNQIYCNVNGNFSTYTATVIVEFTRTDKP